MNQLFNLPVPTIFAHRGVSAVAPENTLAAFQGALDQGVKAVEFDVQLSADQHVIVIHDDTVDRTTNGGGKVRELTLNQLKSFDAGSAFSSDFAGESIPTLEEVFKRFGRKLYLNIELKNYATPLDALPERVAALVRQYQLEDWVMFSSFNPIALNRTRRALPDTPIGLLTLKGSSGFLGRNFFTRWLSPQAIHPHKDDVSESFMLNQRRAGRRVNAWTVNELEEMKHLVSLGVDGIITDYPSKALF